MDSVDVVAQVVCNVVSRGAGCRNDRGIVFLDLFDALNRMVASVWL